MAVVPNRRAESLRGRLMLASDVSLTQATDNVALLPDLSGTVIEFERRGVRRRRGIPQPRTSLTGIHFVRYLCRLG